MNGYDANFFLWTQDTTRAIAEKRWDDIDIAAYTFETDCTNESVGDAIREMVDSAEDIKRDEFVAFVDVQQLTALEKQMGYKPGFPMKADATVVYGRSSFNEKPCLFFQWSAIEYVFTADGAGDIEACYGGIRHLKSLVKSRWQKPTNKWVQS